MASPRTCVSQGSTLWQPRGSGPATTPVAGTTLLNFVTVAQVSTKARPVVVPIEAVNPARSREFSVTSTPSQWLSRSGPKSVSFVKYVLAGTVAAAAVGTYTAIG